MNPLQRSLIILTAISAFGILAGCASSSAPHYRDIPAPTPPITNDGDALIKLAATQDSGCADDYENSLYQLASPTNWRVIERLDRERPTTEITPRSDALHQTLKAKLAYLKRQDDRTIQLCQPLLQSPDAVLRSRCQRLSAMSHEHLKQYNDELDLWASLAAQDDNDAWWVKTHSAPWLSQLSHQHSYQIDSWSQASNSVFQQQNWRLVQLLKQGQRLVPNQQALFGQQLQQWQRGDWIAPDHEKSDAAWQVTQQHSQGLTRYPYQSLATTTPPRKVTLLIPLSGPSAVIGRAVRSGYITAYEQARHKHPNTTPEQSLDFCDTVTQPALDCYQKAIDNGTNWVIGPVRKEAAQTIADHANPHIVTLLLNHHDSPNHALLSLTLSHSDEAADAARRMAREGHRHVMVIAGPSTAERHTAEAFAKAWQGLGGDVIDHVVMAETPQALKTQMQQTLGVTDSYTRAHDFMRAYHLPKSKIKFVPRRRQDIDGFFVATTYANSKQLKPMLNFYYSAGLPVYATSLLNDHQVHLSYDPDFDGIRFADMPASMPDSIYSHAWWHSIWQSHQKLWPDLHQQQWRFVALGIDAFTLTQKLTLLEGIPNVASVPGTTGQLAMTGSGEITRQLDWYVMQNKRINQLLPPPTL